jgi:predicted RNase H-like nuclease (RuvC/YqgF family)
MAENSIESLRSLIHNLELQIRDLNNQCNRQNEHINVIEQTNLTTTNKLSDLNTKTMESQFTIKQHTDKLSELIQIYTKIIETQQELIKRTELIYSAYKSIKIVIGISVGFVSLILAMSGTFIKFIEYFAK